MRIFAYMSERVCIYECGCILCGWVCLCGYVCMRVSMCVCGCVCMCMCMSMWVHDCMCVCTNLRAFFKYIDLLFVKVYMACSQAYDNKAFIFK